MSMQLRPFEIVAHVGEGDLCMELHHWPHRGETHATTMLLKEIPRGKVGRVVADRERKMAEPWSFSLHFVSKQALEVFMGWVKKLHDQYPDPPPPPPEDPAPKPRRKSRKKPAKGSS